MKKNVTKKKEDFINHLDLLIAITAEEAQKNTKNKESREYSELLIMLESLKNFIIDLSYFYFHTCVNRMLTWEQVLTCLTFIKDIIFQPYFSNKDKLIEVDDILIRKFLTLIYEKKYWGDNYWVPYILSENFNILLLFYFPDDLIKKILLHKKTLTIINNSLFQVCRSSHYYKLRILLKSYYKKPEFLDEFNAWLILYDFISEPRALENYNKNNNRLITWEECNSLLKRRLKLLEELFDKNNFKIEPNKKYSNEMFEFVNQKRLEGLKCYVAYQQVLEKYGFNPDKEDSFRKQYYTYLKKRK